MDRFPGRWAVRLLSLALIATGLVLLGSSPQVAHGRIKAGHRCGDSLPGCFKSYRCTSSTGDGVRCGVTDDGEPVYAKSKRGDGKLFRVCAVVPDPNEKCHEKSVVCFIEVFYRGSWCRGVVCGVRTNETDGCND